MQINKCWMPVTCCHIMSNNIKVNEDVLPPVRVSDVATVALLTSHNLRNPWNQICMMNSCMMHSSYLFGFRPSPHGLSYLINDTRSVALAVCLSHVSCCVSSYVGISLSAGLQAVISSHQNSKFRQITLYCSEDNDFRLCRRLKPAPLIEKIDHWRTSSSNSLHMYYESEIPSSSRPLHQGKHLPQTGGIWRRGPHS